RHTIPVSDSIGRDEYSDDVAPPEERTSSSQSHTCKNQPPGLYASSTQSQRVPAVNPQLGSDASLLGGGETAPRSLEDCAALARSILPPSLTSHLQHVQTAQTPQNSPAVCQRHTVYCCDIFRARESECSAARAVARAHCLSRSQCLPKREGPPWTRTLDADPSGALAVLVAARQTFEHSIPDAPPRRIYAIARLKPYKRLQHAADIHADTDEQDTPTFSR
ncbi:hypothetical protein GGG16DRAFT_68160, partial [Schizophyllum commune]